jgi:putative transposase
MITAELRELNRKSHITTPITAKRIAEFLAKVEDHEAVLLQRLRDQESREVLERIGEKKSVPDPGWELPKKEQVRSQSLPQAEEPLLAPVDLTTLHVYEEYH